MQYDLAQELSGVAGYTNLQLLVTTAQPALQSYLASQSTCGTLATCAAINPYNAYSLATYAASTPTAATAPTSSSDIYKARLTYGLPTLSYAAAPTEAAPASGPDASILLGPIYGGSTAAAQNIAPTSGLNGKLATNTINQIVQNTKCNALAAFYGTSRSYGRRTDLYDAAGYFANVNGGLTLAAGDQVLTDVTIAGGGALRGPGAGGTATVGTTASPNSVTVQSGGLLSPGTAGGTLQFRLAGSGAGQFDRLAIGGQAMLAGLLDLELDGFVFDHGLSTFNLLGFGALAGDFAGLTLNNMACAATGTDTYRCNSAVTVSELLTSTGLAVRVSNVPEPASLALLGTTLGGVIWSRRRRA